jgi:flagellar biosynthesis/type III secretory pathway chaperone
LAESTYNFERETNQWSLRRPDFIKNYIENELEVSRGPIKNNKKGMKYNPNEIEAKWQNIGQKIKLCCANNLQNQNITFLTCFHPSGAGLRIGHP